MQDAVEIPLWIDLLAVFIAGLSGSLIAFRNRFDPAGVLVITLVSAMGGGIIRDVLIGRGTPAALANEDYLYTALGAAAVGFVFLRTVRRVNAFFVPIDAAALGLYTFVGMQKGLNADLPVITAMLLGVITAIGGGLMRDVLSGEVPVVLKPGTLTLSAAVVGAGLYGLLHELGVPGYIDVWIVVAVVMLLRLASEYLGWTTPEAAEVPERVTAMGVVIVKAPRRVRWRFPSRSVRTGTETEASQLNSDVDEP
ncbi:MAG TPA: trimeric intracellular cation channel family protein [Dehalococcoidia bacterium]|nr:trimeric intracellular cation channel family protein [Dehalococcoidia bacterium]